MGNMTKKRFSTRDIILAGLFCGLMIVGANLRIPFALVPLTFQPFFAVLSGLLLGPALASLSMSAYILLGLAGLPVFASSGAGISYVLQVSFGFLIGFLLSAWVSGTIANGKNRPTFARMLSASAAGLVAIYAVGILYMYGIQSIYLAKSVTLFSLAKVMLPFFLKDAVLFAGASLLAARLVPLLRVNRI